MNTCYMYAHSGTCSVRHVHAKCGVLCLVLTQCLVLSTTQVESGDYLAIMKPTNDLSTVTSLCVTPPVQKWNEVSGLSGTVHAVL